MSGFGWFLSGLFAGTVATTLSMTYFATRYLPREAAVFAAAVVDALRKEEG